MEKKWLLVKDSDGERGVDGKKKFYEIVIKDCLVTVTWGKFEAIGGQQSKDHWFDNGRSALAWAEETRNAKRKKGYDLLLVA